MESVTPDLLARQTTQSPQGHRRYRQRSPTSEASCYLPEGPRTMLPRQLPLTGSPLRARPPPVHDSEAMAAPPGCPFRLVHLRPSRQHRCGETSHAVVPTTVPETTVLPEATECQAPNGPLLAPPPLSAPKGLPPWAGSADPPYEPPPRQLFVIRHLEAGRGSSAAATPPPMTRRTRGAPPPWPSRWPAPTMARQEE